MFLLRGSGEMDYWKTLRNALGTQQLILNGAAGAIIINDKILLVRKNSSSRWYIPGGTQELNESIQVTIIREIKEEHGLNLGIDKLISVYSSPKWLLELSNGDRIQQVTFFFLMNGVFDINDINLQLSELNEYAFFGLDEIPEYTMECCKEKIRDLIEFKGIVFLK